MKRAVIVGLLGLFVLGCAKPLSPVPYAATPVRATAKRAEPKLDASKFKAEAFTYRYMVVTGAPGAAVGDGIWVCLGEFTEPQRGFKAPIQPDGSAVRNLDKPVVDKVTVWSYIEEGQYYRWSQPIVLEVKPAPPMGQRR